MSVSGPWRIRRLYFGKDAVSESLLLDAHELLQHLVGGRDNPRRRRVGALRGDQIGKFLRQIDGRRNFPI